MLNKFFITSTQETFKDDQRGKDGEVYGQNSQNFSNGVQDFSSTNRKKIL